MMKQASIKYSLSRVVYSVFIIYFALSSIQNLHNPYVGELLYTRNNNTHTHGIQL